MWQSLISGEEAILKRLLAPDSKEYDDLLSNLDSDVELRGKEALLNILDKCDTKEPRVKEALMRHKELLLEIKNDSKRALELSKEYVKQFPKI